MTHEWRNVVIDTQTPLRRVLEVVDREALRLAVVVDENQRLAGVISDGDIRRALLDGKGMDALAGEIMNPNPVTASADATDGELRALMRERDILSIPLIDSERKVVGLKVLKNIAYKQQVDNPVFVMAGGLGTRLSPLTDDCPKPMLEVDGRPILEITLEKIIDCGFRNIYFSTFYMPEIIRDHFGDGSKFGCSINYVHEEKPLGTAGALGELPDDLPDLPLVMLNGDIVTNADLASLLKFHNKLGGVATVSSRQFEFQVPYGVIESDAGRISNIIEKPSYSYFINAGMYVVSSELRKSVSPGIHLNMPDLLKQQIDLGHQVNVYPIHEYWIDIGTLPDFRRAQELYKDKKGGKKSDGRP